jgi:hypothetical protein
MAIDDEDGTVYASLSDGRVVHLSAQGEFLSTLFFSGGYVTSDVKARKNGVDASTAAKMDWCSAEARAHRLAWDRAGERSCGRPLGIRYLPAGRVVSAVCAQQIYNQRVTFMRSSCLTVNLIDHIIIVLS